VKIDFKELLGEGAFGYVYKGTYEGKDVAVKVVDKLNEKQRIEYDEHLRLTHENVVKLLHVHDSKDGLRT
jgi:predicted Ser/Thr protein kinase